MVCLRTAFVKERPTFALMKCYCYELIKPWLLIWSFGYLPFTSSWQACQALLVAHGMQIVK